MGQTAGGIHHGKSKGGFLVARRVASGLVVAGQNLPERIALAEALAIAGGGEDLSRLGEWLSRGELFLPKLPRAGY